MRAVCGRAAVAPTRRTTPSFSAVRRAFWASEERFSISSRKSVPPAAASKTPGRSATDPVYEPRTEPKSAACRSVSGTVAQSKATSGPRRDESGWITSFTRKFLPEPVGPVRRSGSGVGAREAIRRRRSLIAALLPQKNLPVEGGDSRSSSTRRTRRTRPSPVASSSPTVYVNASARRRRASSSNGISSCAVVSTTGRSLSRCRRRSRMNRPCRSRRSRRSRFPAGVSPSGRRSGRRSSSEMSNLRSRTTRSGIRPARARAASASGQLPAQAFSAEGPSRTRSGAWRCRKFAVFG